MTATVTRRLEGEVSVVTLAQPAKRNALTHEMLEMLADFMKSPEGKAVVLTGEGDAFSSGADLDAVGTSRLVELLETRLARAADAVAACPVPVIAAVETLCLGAAVELAAACDIRVVASDTWFEVPAARLGILYRPAGLQRLHDRLGDHLTRRLLLANERIPAHAMGAFSAPVVPPGSAFAEAHRLAVRIASLDPMAVVSTKSLLNEIEHDAADGAMWEEMRRRLLERR